MLGPYKRSILRVTELLRDLQAAKDDMAKLMGFQRELVRQIVRSERRLSAVRRRRSELKKLLKSGRLSRAETDELRKGIKRTEHRIALYKQLMFVWRCFGDGVAFSYVDKFALKHTFLNTHDLDKKQRAGALADKAGFRNEWALVQSLCRRGFPAMLSDVTNIIRHGDVCVLVGPDPFPIEVKSSENSNARVDRQLEHLKTLHAFYQTDTAQEFRGLPGRVVRREFKTPEITYADALNECIEASRASGYARVSPERGLNYICLRGTAAADQMEEAAVRDSVFAALNERKSSGEWPPYYPFTLTIRDAAALYEFIEGEIYLIVTLHMPTLIEKFQEAGLHAEVIEDDDYAIQLSRHAGAVMGQDFVSRLSHQLLGRMFFEMQSPDWFARVHAQNFRDLEEEHKVLFDGAATDSQP